MGIVKKKNKIVSIGFVLNHKCVGSLGLRLIENSARPVRAEIANPVLR